MRCHYEVLNISRDANDAEIKTAYKKLALRWHPDKNLDDSENAKEQFQLVQQAYEVLCDRQERAWYDRHREQILRGANSEFSDENLDVFQYFTTSCFKGYNDDEQGFYTVYRKVFEQIAKEDMDFYEDKEEFCNIPTFGTSTSDYDSVVNPFYAYWMSYSTKKSYVWLDPYNIKDVRDRRLLKAVEKENKKIRQKAKKERNEEIRNLVSYIRKRDKRVEAWNKLNNLKIEVNRQRQNEIRNKKLEEQRKINASEVQADWTKFENVSLELQEIEKNIEKEFGNSDSSDSEDESDLYCVACNKLFKTEKSFQNHESSKKHKENVELLKAQMLEEDLEYESIDSDAEDERSISEEQNRVFSEEKPIPESLANDETSSKEEDNLLHQEKSGPSNSDSDVRKNESKKQQKTKKNRIVLKVDSSDDEHVLSTLPASTSSEDDFNTTMKGKRKNKSKIKKTVRKSSTINEIVHDENIRTATSETTNDNYQEMNKPVLHLCSTCQKDFPSKNKLFQHLRKEGHSIFLGESHSSINKKNKKKK